MPSAKVTIRDIAEKLHISKSTVALALNGSYGLSEETVAKIMITALDLGYDFGKLKKKGRIKNRITVLSPNHALYNDFWGDVYMGMEQEVISHGMKLDVHFYDANMTGDELKLSVNTSGTCGVLIVDFSIDDAQNRQLLSVLTEQGLPVVLVDPRRHHGTKCTQVFVTNYFSGYGCAEYLLEKGHKKLAFLGNIDYGSGFYFRYLGFRDGVQNAGDAEFVPILGGDKEGDFICNIAEFGRVFASAHPPTALFCGNDLMAFAVYDQLHNMGMKVFDDVSVVGFDDRERSVFLNPPLTTYHIDKKELGRFAVELLCDKINGTEVSNRIVELSAELIERGSVKQISLNDSRLK